MSPSLTLGFQALILCGPGVSLNTFTSKPDDFPKCLIQVANRPMVYYPIEFCRRTGITDITLITPPSSFPAVNSAMKLDPHLTSFHSPIPSIIAPKGLDMTMGTAQLLRLPEVQAVIKTDFILLPCDLICEVSGEALIEAWMTTQGVVNQSKSARERRNSFNTFDKKPLDVRQKGRHGALTIYYQTATKDDTIKNEATDFVAIAPLTHDEAAVIPSTDPEQAPIRFNLFKLLLSTPMATIKDKMEQEKGLLLRHSLLQTHARIRLLTTFRDAHLYIFPRRVRDLVRGQQRLQSISDDLIGNWAKSCWQDGLGENLGLTRMIQYSTVNLEESSFDSNIEAKYIDPRIDLQRLSTTKSALNTLPPKYIHDPKSLKAEKNPPPATPADLPQLLAYVYRGGNLIRRIDNPSLLLATSLHLAKLPSIEEVGRESASPFAHARKISSPELVAGRSMVTAHDCLLGDHVTIESTAVVKESCIGSNCQIHRGARIIRCVVMEGAVVEERVQLSGCVIGRRARIGRESVLRDCEVQDCNVVSGKVEARDRKFMVFETGGEVEDGVETEGESEE
ncbi:hypothetical protein MYU51_021159 [Penicillium brevicompactum]|uniref:uncharacterized protein n=1 Tax=Penicillium brevicompactum TaxID=5074 RepID=UPI00253FCD6D|nr:uncharacterized protein N7506_006956 [Penicillium brevicompactum]KAJ5333173.1 hypothetical protein N7506_006956 [Penicillium brevicompactum]